jgi:hypothetical protein
MRPSLTNLPQRTAEKARAAAAGSPVPAGQEPAAAEDVTTPTARSRGAMRRRVRRLGRVREVLLRELGALVVEMRRLERDNPDLIARKAAEIRAIDDQLGGLRRALGERQTVEQVVAAGVSGSCTRCGTLIATDDRFCPNCGLAVVEGERAATEPGPTGAAESSATARAEPRADSEPGASGASAAEDGAAQQPAPAAAAPAPPPPPPPPPPPGEAPTERLSAAAPRQP